MTPDIQEWLDKAEGDWDTANRELRVRKNPDYDAACFHAKQSAEKYLKGRLIDAEIAFPKIHDLGVLLDLLLSVHPEWELLRPDAILLTQYAVFFLYPGRSADKPQARAAATASSRIRERVRHALGIRNGNGTFRKSNPPKSPRARRKSSRRK